MHTSFGMKLAKLHKVLKIKQSDWLRKYIDFNTDKTKNVGKRKDESNWFEKDFFKNWWLIVFMINNRKFEGKNYVRLVNNAKD